MYFGSRNFGWQLKLPMADSRGQKMKTEFGPNNFLLEITPVTTKVHKVTHLTNPKK